MNALEILQGVFESPASGAALWGFASAFVLSMLLVVTKGWHGVLTIDNAKGVQKFHTAPTPRVGGGFHLFGAGGGMGQSSARGAGLAHPDSFCRLARLPLRLGRGHHQTRWGHAAFVGHHGLGLAGLVDYRAGPHPR